jgi:hypothetical protein
MMVMVMHMHSVLAQRCKARPNSGKTFSKLCTRRLDRIGSSRAHEAAPSCMLWYKL